MQTTTVIQSNTRIVKWDHVFTVSLKREQHFLWIHSITFQSPVTHWRRQSPGWSWPRWTPMKPTGPFCDSFVLRVVSGACCSPEDLQVWKQGTVTFADQAAGTVSYSSMYPSRKGSMYEGQQIVKLFGQRQPTWGGGGKSTALMILKICRGKEGAKAS